MDKEQDGSWAGQGTGEGRESAEPHAAPSAPPAGASQDEEFRLAPPSGSFAPPGGAVAPPGRSVAPPARSVAPPGADARPADPGEGPYVVAGYPAARPRTSYDRPGGNPYAGSPAARPVPPSATASPAAPPVPPAAVGSSALPPYPPGQPYPSASQPYPPTGQPYPPPNQPYPPTAAPAPGTPPVPGPPAYPGAANPYAGYPGTPGALYPGYPGTKPAGTPGKALGIASLCVAVAGLAISWIPFLNIFTFPIGVVALGLGIPALVKGFRARNMARWFSIAGLATAILSLVIAASVMEALRDSFRQAGLGSSSAAPERSGPGPVAGTPEASASPDEYTFEIGETYRSEVLSAPANSVGEKVQVGDYTVTFTGVDGNASAEVQERDPLAGTPDHNYVMFEFDTVYNGDGEGRLWLDLAPEFIGADSRSYSVLDCSLDLGVNAFDLPNLGKGDSRTYEVCMDLPDAALGEDSRISLRMVLAEEDGPVYWRLP